MFIEPSFLSQPVSKHNQTRSVLMDVLNELEHSTSTEFGFATSKSLERLVGQHKRDLDKVHNRARRKSPCIRLGLQEIVVRIFLHMLLSPTSWKIIHIACQVFITIAQHIDRLEPTAKLDSVRAIHLHPIEPGPQVTEQQSDCACHSKCVAIKISLCLNLPVISNPVSHALGHGSRCIPDAWR